MFSAIIADDSEKWKHLFATRTGPALARSIAGAMALVGDRDAPDHRRLKGLAELRGVMQTVEAFRRGRVAAK
jgi:hypothetical protein